MTRRILCLDFDGVIHQYDSPWEGPGVIKDMPVFGAITFMHRAIQHFDIAVLSARSAYPEGITAMRNYIQVASGPLWQDTDISRGLNQVTFPTSKPAAFVMIDDRSLTFTGIFPAIEQLKAFKPWNKR